MGVVFQGKFTFFWRYLIAVVVVILFVFIPKNTYSQTNPNNNPPHFAQMLHALETYQDKNVYPVFLVLQKEMEEKLPTKDRNKVIALRKSFFILQKNKNIIFQEKDKNSKNAFTQISADSVMNFWEFYQTEETRLWQEMDKQVQKYAPLYEKILQKQTSNMKSWRKDMEKIINIYEKKQNPNTGVFFGKFNFGKFFDLVDVMLWQYEKLPQEAQAEGKTRE